MKTYYVGNIPFNGDNSLQHYGRKGMKWGKNIFTDALDAASGFATGAANKVSKFATNTYNSARKGAVNAYNSGKEFLTGANAKKNLEKAKSIQKPNKANAAYGVTSRSSYDRKQEAKTLRGNGPEASSASKEREAKRLDVLSKKQSNLAAGHMRSRNEASRIRGAQVMKAQMAYDKTLPGRIDKAQVNIEKTVNESYQEVIEWLDKNKKKAKKAANSAASTISKSANTALSTVKATASSTAKKVGNFFERLFG